MRNSKSGSTPKTSTVQNESITNNAEKSSAKKLRQARLPFKIIAPGTSPTDSTTTSSHSVSDKGKDVVKETQNADGRKRKLSYDDAKDDCVNPTSVKEVDNVSKENVETLAAAATKKKKVCTKTAVEVVSLVDEDNDDNIESSKVTATSALANDNESDVKTPKSVSKDKKRGAGTPKTASAQKEKDGSSNKLTIKLPLSAGKNKRRKSCVKNAQTEKPNNTQQELSSDDIEEISAALNPQKRKKLNDEDKEAKTPKEHCASNVQEKEIATVDLDTASEDEEKNVKETLQTSEMVSRETSEKQEDKTTQVFSKRISRSSEKSPVKPAKTTVLEQRFSKRISKPSEKSPAEPAKTTVLEQPSDNENIEISDSSDDKETDEKENHEQSILNDKEADNEADDERDSLAKKDEKNSSDLDEKSKLTCIEQKQKDEKSTDVSAKTLTPKQLKLMEQRRKAREEKERKLQEEKLKKQQEKEEKELARKREREEREEQKRKEREEKEEQKRKEREEKERKRLAEVEAKNEEKRKRAEAKEEELRKKEEERKRKEQEKEEAELKKKKAAQAFTKFFVAKTPSNNQLKNDEESNTGDGSKLLAFRPFQIKGDMKLAPIMRKTFTTEGKNRLDEMLGFKNKTDDNDDDDTIVRRKPLTKSQLYLAELRSGKILPGRWRRPSTESKDDVILVEDELERVGQEIVEEVPAYVREEMRVKFYKFHDNRRPPYYGTWRKKSSVVKPRKPFAQDKKMFDYEVDSDDEWEEEEPGESLEDGSDEDKEKESEDEDYEVDNEWFVPHGHLSEEEMQNEDEFGLGDDNTREAQKAKLQLLQQEFAQEMKKKTEKIKPRLIGCIWADVNGNRPPDCAAILWDTLEKKSMMFVEPPLTEEPEVDRSSEINSPSAASNGNAEKTTEKTKPINLSDDMIKDLTRLVHGNNHAKNFLINEYLAYVEKTEESVKSGDLRKPLKSVVRDKIDEIAEWQVVYANASSIQEMEKVNEETNDKKKKKVKRRLCWVVKQEMLDKMDLSSLELHNSWQYTLPPKFVKTEKDPKLDETATKSTAECSTNSRDKGVEEKESLLKEKLPSPSPTNKSSTETSSNKKKSNTAATQKAKKRVPLLMSVARGQQISTPAKNKLISQFLQQKDKDNVTTPASPMSTKARSTAVTSPNIEDDDVVILD